MGLLYGRAGRLTAQNGGLRRGQSPGSAPASTSAMTNVDMAALSKMVKDAVEGNNATLMDRIEASILPKVEETATKAAAASKFSKCMKLAKAKKAAAAPKAGAK